MTSTEFDIRLSRWVGKDRTTGSLVWALANDRELEETLSRMVEAEKVRMDAEWASVEEDFLGGYVLIESLDNALKVIGRDKPV